MSIKIQGTTVIDDSRNIINAASIQFANASTQNTAGFAVSYGTKLYNKGLLYTLNDPNVYGNSIDSFTFSIDMSGNYTVVGAYSESEVGGTESGKVYVYNTTTGEMLYSINNPNPYGTVSGDWFGFSVAVDGSYLIVGAPFEDDVGGADSGKAYIFNTSTGQLVQTLNNPTAYGTSANDYFGYSVTISGNYAIVGALYESDAGGGASGKVYIFDVTSGALLYTLDNPNPYDTSAGDSFGNSISAYGNYVIVGALGEDDVSGTQSGKAYIFNMKSGQLLWTLNNPNPYLTADYDSFGNSVAIHGNYAIVGAYNEGDINGDGSSGKAYIYNVTTGQLVWTLNNPNAYSTSTNDAFGQSVAISSNYAIVGASSEDDAGGFDSGKAYMFNLLDGSLVATLNNPNAYGASTSDAFGQSVAISGNYVLVGAYAEASAAGSYSGKGYMFLTDNVYSDTNIKKIKFDTGVELDMTHPIFSVAHPQGQLIKTLDNPNAYGTAAFDNFGISVAISGNYAIVGASSEDDAGGTESGKAYIFNATTGTLLYTLNNPNAYSTSAGDYFGNSVAISGNYAIVGASSEDDVGGISSGKAYIYNVTTGALLWTLNNPNPYSTSTADQFGNSVAISGNYAIVSARYEDDAGGNDSGKAYIYNVTNGQLIWTLSNPNSSANDQFGNSVAISGNYAIVGAKFESDAGRINSGKAYIYNVTTGELLYTLNNPNAYSTSGGDEFGKSVAISGNYAIVGAWNEDDAGGVSSGKAYIFNVTTGQLLWTLNNPNAYDTSVSDFFGTTVAISGNYIIVGTPDEKDAGGTSSGKAYIYNATTGALLYTLNNPNAYSTSAGDNFGISVAISGNYAIVSAYGESDAGGAQSGKAYIFATRDLTYLDKLTTIAESL